MYRSPIASRLVAFLLLASVCVVSLFAGTARVRADGGSNSGNSRVDRCSPDLLQIVNSDPTRRVRAIVQSSTNSTGLLDSLVQQLGGTILATFSQLNARLVDISANSAQALAYEDGITYMSLDNYVGASGHIVTTTGAQQMRVQKNFLGLPYTLDGSNVTIAIMDSGIDTTHKSFAGKLFKIRKVLKLHSNRDSAA
jgi:subtilisin family serine protease